MSQTATQATARDFRQTRRASAAAARPQRKVVRGGQSADAQVADSEAATLGDRCASPASFVEAPFSCRGASSPARRTSHGGGRRYRGERATESSRHQPHSRWTAARPVRSSRVRCRETGSTERSTAPAAAGNVPARARRAIKAAPSPSYRHRVAPPPRLSRAEPSIDLCLLRRGQRPGEGHQDRVTVGVVVTEPHAEPCRSELSPDLTATASWEQQLVGDLLRRSRAAL